MRNGDRTILFLSCRVPQLSFNSRTVFHCHIFSGELDANRRPRCLGQLVLQVAAKEARFADRYVPNQDNYIILQNVE